MKRIVSIIFLTALLAIPALSQYSVKVGTAAPAFAATLLGGDAINLDDLRGRVVVIAFWSTKCAICHHELPKLNQLTTRYDPKKVVFLALSMEPEEKIGDYVRNNPLNMQIIPNSFGIVLKYADRDRNDSLDMGFPAFFVIDQSGLVRHRSSGYDKTGPLDVAVGKLLTK